MTDNFESALHHRAVRSRSEFSQEHVSELQRRVNFLQESLEGDVPHQMLPYEALVQCIFGTNGRPPKISRLIKIAREAVARQIDTNPEAYDLNEHAFWIPDSTEQRLLTPVGALIVARAWTFPGSLLPYNMFSQNDHDEVGFWSVYLYDIIAKVFAESPGNMPAWVSDPVRHGLVRARMSNAAFQESVRAYHQDSHRALPNHYETPFTRLQAYQVKEVLDEDTQQVLSHRLAFRSAVDVLDAMKTYFSTSRKFEKSSKRSDVSEEHFDEYTNVMLLNLCSHVMQQIMTVFRAKHEGRAGGVGPWMDPDHILTTPAEILTLTEQITMQHEPDYYPKVGPYERIPMPSRTKRRTMHQHQHQMATNAYAMSSSMQAMTPLSGINPSPVMSPRVNYHYPVERTRVASTTQIPTATLPIGLPTRIDSSSVQARPAFLTMPPTRAAMTRPTMTVTQRPLASKNPIHHPQTSVNLHMQMVDDEPSNVATMLPLATIAVPAARSATSAVGPVANGFPFADGPSGKKANPHRVVMATNASNSVERSSPNEAASSSHAISRSSPHQGVYQTVKKSVEQGNGEHDQTVADQSLATEEEDSSTDNDNDNDNNDDGDDGSDNGEVIKASAQPLMTSRKRPNLALFSPTTASTAPENSMPQSLKRAPVVAVATTTNTTRTPNAPLPLAHEAQEELRRNLQVLADTVRNLKTFNALQSNFSKYEGASKNGMQALTTIIDELNKNPSLVTDLNTHKLSVEDYMRRKR